MCQNVSPWHQQEGESEEYYQYFRLYLDQPAPRNLKQVAETAKRHYGHIRRCATQQKWKKRARAWDERVELAEDTAILDEVAQTAKAHLSVLRTARHLATENIKKLREKAKDTKKPTISAKDTIQILKEVISLERLIVGQATERVARQDTVDLSRLSSDQVWALKEALQVARGDAPSAEQSPDVADD